MTPSFGSPSFTPHVQTQRFLTDDWRQHGKLVSISDPYGFYSNMVARHTDNLVGFYNLAPTDWSKFNFGKGWTRTPIQQHGWVNLGRALVLYSLDGKSNTVIRGGGVLIARRCQAWSAGSGAS